MYRSIIGPFNLGIHEFGHLIFSPLGLFFNIIGGTLIQLAVPLYGMVNFLKQEDYFAVSLCFGWLSTNFFDIADYASDATDMHIPLVSPFSGHIYHDWNYLLSKLQILHLDGTIAFLLRTAGVLSMSICLITGCWMIWLMITPKKQS